jgi:predicted nuclease with RNAse H fold
MSEIIVFPLARPVAHGAAQGASRSGEAVATLADRLSKIERSESGDETIMELLADAELAALDALAAAQARSHADVTLKLAALLRRVEADDETLLPAGEVALLRSALRDMRRLSRRPVAARA